MYVSEQQIMVARPHMIHHVNPFR